MTYSNKAGGNKFWEIDVEENQRISHKSKIRGKGIGKAFLKLIQRRNSHISTSKNLLLQVSYNYFQ